MAVVAGMLALIIALVFPGLPLTVRVSYKLPSDVRSLEIQYESEGEIIRTARFQWSGQRSPEVVRHEPELASGWYVIDVTIKAEGVAPRKVRRTVKIDPRRVTHMDLRAGE